MQSPQRWQRSRKSASGSEPGGRIKFGEGVFDNFPSSLPKSGREIPASSPPHQCPAADIGFCIFFVYPLETKSQGIFLAGVCTVKT